MPDWGLEGGECGLGKVARSNGYGYEEVMDGDVTLVGFILFRFDHELVQQSASTGSTAHVGYSSSERKDKILQRSNAARA